MNNGVNNSNAQQNQVTGGALGQSPNQQQGFNNTIQGQVGSINSNMQVANPTVGGQSIVNSQITTQSVDNQNPQGVDNDKSKGRKKKKNVLAWFFFLLVIFLAGYNYYTMQQHKLMVAKLKDECSPVSTEKGEKELALDSTIVQDLYSKVATNIREDLASSNLDDQMKLYLAYRQVANRKIYESNCNLFSKTAMEPYICTETATFSPDAFKEETLQVEVKKLFGESTNIPNANIQLGKTCIGGYQYIAERGEYVKGYCLEEQTTQYRVTKKLVGATSNKSTITLKEEVKYYGAEQLKIPENLRSGIYVYKFKLDTNYNYVYISKTFEE